MQNMNNDSSRNGGIAKLLAAICGTGRAVALRVLVVIVTLALVLESSPVSQLAYAGEADSAETVASEAPETGNAGSEDGAAAEGDSTQADADAADAAEGDNAAADASAEDADSNAGISLASEDDAAALSNEASDKPVDGQKYGNITYKQNTTANGFLSSDYDAWRDGGTSLGIANSFHIVAFDTLNAGVDIYGNVLARNVSTIVDSGTSEKFVNIYGHNTLSYIQNYSGTFGRWDKSGDGCVVFGSDVNLTTRNNSELLLNGSRVESPNTVVQDADTATNPFIDIDSLESFMYTTSATLAAQAEVGVTKELKNDGKILELTVADGLSGAGYVSLTAADLAKSGEGINIKNLDRVQGGTGLVINVDCQGQSSIAIPKTYLYVGDQRVGIGETDSVFGDTGYVIYNFYNTGDDANIQVGECTASVLAPGANLTLGPGSACGTFIAQNVTVVAESHTRPFHGTIKPGKDDSGDEGDDEMDFSLSGYSMAAEGEAVAADKVCYVDPKVVKVLEGRALTAGEFSFQLISDTTGGVVSEATNDEAGMVDFDAANNVTGDPDNPSCLKFTSAGTYSYTVRETPGQTKDPTVVYSKEVVKFVTTIAANEDGSLYEAESHYVKYASAADAAAGVNGTTYAASEHPTITNKVRGLSLALTKTSAETGEALEGAVYALYRVDESAAGGSVQVMSATSDENGLMVFTAANASDIAAGQSYYFQEVSAPEGYTVSEVRSDTFAIVDNGDGTYSLSYEGDDATAGSPSYAGTTADPIVYKAGTGVSDTELDVTIGKFTSDGAALAGAELVVRDEDGNEVATWTSTAAGYVLHGLTAGKTYTLSESAAPDGYAKAEEVTFTVDEYGNVQIVGGAATGDMPNAYAEGSSVSLVDYKLDVREEQKVVTREEGTPTSGSGTSKGGRLPQTSDVQTALIYVLAAGCALMAFGLARRRLRRR